jgi:hypothetical protein
VDPGPFLRNWTAHDLDRIRAATVMRERVEGRGVAHFTCDACDYRHGCKYVYDAYNTDGLCLVLSIAPRPTYRL